MADNVTTQRSKGTVKWFDGRKGFGFITPDDDDEDLFVHQTSIRFDGFRTLFDGQRVEFTVEIGDDGRTRASDVIPLRSHSRPPAGGRGGGGGGVDCYNCGRFGHFARDCYHQRGGRGYGGYRGGRGGNDEDYSGGFQSRRGGGGGRGFRGGFQSGSGSSYGGGFRGGFRGGRGGGGGGGGRGGGGGGCYNCGEEGHFARDCQGNQI